eukprot:jgi/Tetstr1/456899/TSEL_043569.t1
MDPVEKRKAAMLRFTERLKNEPCVIKARQRAKEEKSASGVRPGGLRHHPSAKDMVAYTAAKRKAMVKARVRDMAKKDLNYRLSLIQDLNFKEVPPSQHPTWAKELHAAATRIQRLWRQWQRSLKHIAMKASIESEAMKVHQWEAPVMAAPIDSGRSSPELVDDSTTQSSSTASSVGSVREYAPSPSPDLPAIEEESPRLAPQQTSESGAPVSTAQQSRSPPLQRLGEDYPMGGQPDTPAMSKPKPKLGQKAIERTQAKSARLASTRSLPQPDYSSFRRSAPASRPTRALPPAKPKLPTIPTAMRPMSTARRRRCREARPGVWSSADSADIGRYLASHRSVHCVSVNLERSIMKAKRRSSMPTPLPWIDAHHSLPDIKLCEPPAPRDEFSLPQLLPYSRSEYFSDPGPPPAGVAGRRTGVAALPLLPGLQAARDTTDPHQTPRSRFSKSARTPTETLRGGKTIPSKGATLELPLLKMVAQEAIMQHLHSGFDRAWRLRHVRL